MAGKRGKGSKKAGKDTPEIDWEDMRAQVEEEHSRRGKKKTYPWTKYWENAHFKRFRRAVYRFCIYGAIMTLVEIIFYNVTRIGREIPVVELMFRFKWLVDVGKHVNLNDMWDVPILSLYGQASLWMFFVYGVIVLFGVEWAYKRFHDKTNFLVRGFIYMVIILTLECVTGWVLYCFTGLFYDPGLKIWYYSGPLSVLRYTSLAIAPIWFVSGLVSENFFHIIFKLQRLKDITKC